MGEKREDEEEEDASGRSSTMVRARGNVPSVRSLIRRATGNVPSVRSDQSDQSDQSDHTAGAESMRPQPKRARKPPEKNVRKEAADEVAWIVQGGDNIVVLPYEESAIGPAFSIPATSD